MADYYKILGVSKKATEDDIKKAYRKLAMEYHPDRNQGNKEAEAKFKEVTEAYQVLSDKKKREAYDNLGHENYKQSAQNGGASSQGFDFGNGDIFSNLGDIFGEFFGGAFGGSNTKAQDRGRDIRYDLDVTLEEVSRGDIKEIKYSRVGNCKACSGTGAQDKKVKNCGNCSGTGEIRNVSRTIFGQFVNVTYCDVCNGKGKIPLENCKTCKGSGHIREIVETKVKIPQGIETGARIRIAGYGEAGDGSSFGDLYIFVRVKPHEIFQREGSNIYCTVPISFTTATLGGEIEVPTLEGKVKLKIPAGTQSGKSFKLKSKGLGSTSVKGDEIITVNIVVPTNLNSKQKDLLEQFNESLHESNHSILKDFWDKIAKAFRG